jgi:2-dehydropantoate 2-reductase
LPLREGIPDNVAMRILVVGAGAVGGYFGARLADAGRDVSFLVRPRKAEAIRNAGLQIVSPHGDSTVQPKLIFADQIAHAYDLVILCVKAYSLDAALDDCAAAVGTGTMILPLLNGMRHIDQLVTRFGEDSVLGGACFIAAEVDADGRLVHLSQIHRMVYGERSGGISARIQDLDDVLQGAKFEARASGEIVQEMWEKWVLLASLGAATCLLRGSIGEIEAVPGGAAVVRAILAECREISDASGFPPGEGFLSRTEKMLTAPGSSLTASMYRDMTRGFPVEVEQILGDLIERGRRLGVRSPRLEAACANLRVYEGRRLRDYAVAVR